MSKMIEDAKRISDALNGTDSKVSSDLKKIIKYISKSPSGVIVEIPWQADGNGEYMESITIVCTKVTKERIYFINPIKVSLQPCVIKEENNKGPARRIETDGLESISLPDLIKLSKKGEILGIIRE